VLGCAIAYVYCAAERYVYYWDYGGFWLVTAGQVSLWQTWPRQALLTVWWSLGEDYPRIYTLAPTPFLLLFGNSRIAYVIALTLVYQIPFVLLMGATAVQIIRRNAATVFWSTAFLTLSVPTLWIGTLRGYPDMGGAALVALAVLAYLYNPELSRPWQPFVIGLCLAMAPLFRRHFAYTVVIFFLVAGAFAIVRGISQVRRNRAEGLRSMGRQLARLALAGGVFAGFLATVGHRWLQYALSLDRRGLYKSYEQSLWAWLDWEVRGYGALIWLMAGLGFAVAIAANKCSRERALFLACLNCATLVVWLTSIRQFGWHYHLHFAPLVVIGLVLLTWTCVKGRSTLAARSIILAGTAVLLLVNSAVGLVGYQSARLARVRPAFAEAGGPLVRADYDEVMRLVDYLRIHVEKDAPIYVIDSSRLLNDDLLRKAEIAAYGTAGTKLTVQVSPHVDSRDFLPLEVILRASYVVTSDPFRPELGHMTVPQKLVTAGANAVLGDWPTARDFERLPQTFVLGSGTTFSILRRVRPTPWAAALETLMKMRDFVGGSLPRFDWTLLQEPFPSSIARNDAGGYSCRTHLGFADQAPWAPVLAYTGPLQSPTRLELTLEYADQQNFQKASAARIAVWALADQGDLMQVAGATTTHGRQRERLSLPLILTQDARALAVEIVAAGDHPSITCGTLNLQEISVVPNG